MKKLILLVAVVIGITSCEKQDYLPKEKVLNAQSEDTLKYNLDWSSTQLGINIKDLKPSSVSKLVDYNSSTREQIVYGEWINFYNADSTILIQFVYYYQGGIKQGTGRINGKSFILNVENNTINICNSYQNVEVVYDLFSDEEDIDS